MQESEIIFQGPGPFHLPVAHGATAVGHQGNGVTLTVLCVLPERGGKPEPVSVQMLASVAREFAVSILKAAEADKRA